LSFKSSEMLAKQLEPDVFGHICDPSSQVVHLQEAEARGMPRMEPQMEPQRQEESSLKAFTDLHF